MNAVTISDFVFILAASSVLMSDGAQHHGFCAFSDSNPVKVGGTATFACYYVLFSDDVVDNIFWSANQPAKDLKLAPGEGSSCSVVETTPSLSNYTFRHTCDMVNNRFTLSIVGVTESDINTNNKWCVEIQHGHFWFDGYFCASITKATNGKTVKAQTLTTAEATTQRTGKESTTGSSYTEQPPASTTNTLVLKPAGISETITPARIAEVTTPSARSGSEAASRTQRLFWGLVVVVSYWL